MRRRKAPLGDVTVETMMRDVTLVLGAAFLILNLANAVLDRIDIRPQPTQIGIKIVKDYLMTKIKSNEFRYRRPLYNAGINQTYFNQFLKKDGLFTEDRIISIFPNSTVIPISLDGPIRDYLVITATDTQNIAWDGLNVAYIDPTERKKLFVLAFFAPEDEVSRSENKINVEFFVDECNWDIPKQKWKRSVPKRSKNVIEALNAVFRNEYNRIPKE